MSDGAPLLIPFAASSSPGCHEALKSLELPHLSRLLARLGRGARLEGDESRLSMPHERVLARALGLPDEDGRIPLAAWQAVTSGQAQIGDACAWITPCHWRVGTDHVAMDLVDALDLKEEASRDFLAAMQPYFQEDGIAVTWLSPTRWLARGEAFNDFAGASLDRVEGREIDAFMPRAKEAAKVRRLQQEMQMLLYRHPGNDAREARGLRSINSFWVSGAGVLPAAPQLHPAPRVIDTLRAPALNEDWAAWCAAWREIDAREIAPLADARQTAGTGALQLTLCGERHAQAFTSTIPRSFTQRIASLFSREQPAALLADL
jgi:hypothetical protein